MFPKDLEVGELKAQVTKFKDVEFEDALQYTGFGKFHYIIILIGGLCLMGVNNEGYAIGYILPSAECELNLDTQSKGILASSTFIGVMGSSWFWGCLSDKKGRRSVLMITLCLAFFCSVSASFIQSFWGFAVLRLFSGVFISGSSIIFAYLGEFLTNTHKSKSMAQMSYFIGIALVILPGLAWILLPLNFTVEFIGLRVNSWRLFMIMSSLPSLIVSISFLKLPESPKFLYYAGKRDEALQILKKVYFINTGNPESMFPVISLKELGLKADDVEEKSILKALWDQSVPLFKRPYLKYTLIGCILQAGAFAVSSALLVWYPDIINRLSATKDMSSLTVCQALSFTSETKKDVINQCVDIAVDDQTYIQNMLVGVIYFAGYVTWSFVVNYIGNRNFFILCMAIASLEIFALNFIVDKLVIKLVLVSFLPICGITVSVISAMIVDIIPTNLCGMAVCVTMTAGRLGNVLSSTIVGILLHWNCIVTFASYTLCCIGCIFFVFVFPNKPKAI